MLILIGQIRHVRLYWPKILCFAEYAKRHHHVMCLIRELSLQPLYDVMAQLANRGFFFQSGVEHAVLPVRKPAYTEGRLKSESDIVRR